MGNLPARRGGPAAFAVEGQIVAAAKALSRALDDDDMDLLVGVGPLHGLSDFTGSGLVDGIQPFGSVEQQAGDARVVAIFVDTQGAVFGHEGPPFRCSFINNFINSIDMKLALCV
jgi:hypothetical protein